MEIKEFTAISAKPAYFDEEIVNTCSSDRQPRADAGFPIEMSQICGFSQMLHKFSIKNLIKT